MPLASLVLEEVVQDNIIELQTLGLRELLRELLRERATRRRRVAGAERGSCVSHVALNPPCERMRAAEYAPRNLFRLLERRHGLAKIIQRGVGVEVGSVSGRPTYVFQHVQLSAHATTP